LDNDTIYLLDGSGTLVEINMEGNVLNEYVSTWAFTIYEGYLYYLNSEKQAVKAKIDDSDSISNLGNYKDKGPLDFYVYDDYVYFITSNLGQNELIAREKDNKMEFFDKPINYYTVFYDNKIVSGPSYYTLEGEYIGDYTTYTDANKIRPTVVGDHLYVYSEEKLDLPEIGRGWYKVE
jgi:hypothetical protein